MGVLFPLAGQPVGLVEMVVAGEDEENEVVERVELLDDQMDQMEHLSNLEIMDLRDIAEEDNDLLRDRLLIMCYTLDDEGEPEMVPVVHDEVEKPVVVVVMERTEPLIADDEVEEVEILPVEMVEMVVRE